MKMRLLYFTTVGMAALFCAPAIAQSAPPPGPPVTMQPIANPPETPDRKMHHAKKMAKKKAGAATAAPQ